MEVKGVGLEVGYDGNIIIPELDITVCKGEITTIVGPNGSGKSTVLKALTRLLGYTKGQVLVNGKEIHFIESSELAKQIGILPQHHNAPPDFKVRDLVAFGRAPYQKWYEKQAADDEQIIEWAMRSAEVWEFRDRPVHACSGGETQRVWIAMVLAQQPDILFLDEPTTYLDISYQQEIMRLIRQLNRNHGIGVVMVLHDLVQAMEVSDKVIVLKDGKKYAEGTPEEVITTRMLKEVYRVNSRIIRLPDRKRPLLVLEEIL